MICFQDEISDEENEYLSNSCRDFLRIYQESFGEDEMFHNFHLLSHLPRNCFLHGPSWMNSMFPYESFNHRLNGNVHTNFNFERKAMVCHSSEATIENMICKRSQEFPKLKEVAEEIQHDSERSHPPLVVNGIFVSKMDSSYTSWVQLRNGKKGEITCNKKGNVWVLIQDQSGLISCR